MQLNDDNFLLYAIKQYDARDCVRGMPDFNDDLARIKYVHRLISRYKESGILRDRLILNHIIILINCFGIEAANTILFFKLPETHWDTAATFLSFLGALLPHIQMLGIETAGLPMDTKIMDKLHGL